MGGYKSLLLILGCSLETYIYLNHLNHQKVYDIKKADEAKGYRAFSQTLVEALMKKQVRLQVAMATGDR